MSGAAKATSNFYLLGSKAICNPTNDGNSDKQKEPHQDRRNDGDKQHVNELEYMLAWELTCYVRRGFDVMARCAVLVCSSGHSWCCSSLWVLPVGAASPIREADRIPQSGRAGSGHDRAQRPAGLA